MKAPAFSYVRPTTLAHTLELLARYGDDAKLLAGGQSLLAALNMRLDSPRVLIDLNGIEPLSGVRAEAGTITIGALTRHRELERSALIATHLPLLHQAMPHVAHAAIRNRGTFGGSIAHADPAAELPACALALNARLRVASVDGERTVPAESFFTGLFETALRPGEVLVAGEFPMATPGSRSAFVELARRHGDYAIVGLAAHGRLADGMLSNLRLAYFGVGATPVLAREAALHLAAEAYAPPVLERAQAALDADLAPLDDPMCSAATRRHLARVLLGRVCAALVEGAA